MTLVFLFVLGTTAAAALAYVVLGLMGMHFLNAWGLNEPAWQLDRHDLFAGLPGSGWANRLHVYGLLPACLSLLIEGAVYGVKCLIYKAKRCI